MKFHFIEKFGSSGVVKFLQYSNANMSFWVNTSTEALTIWKDGNVGVGTNTPNGLLNVGGNTKIGTAGSPYSGTNITSLTINGVYPVLSLGNTSNRFSILAYSTYTNYETVSNAPHAFSGGSVGIGCVDPGSKLTIESASAATSLSLHGTVLMVRGPNNANRYAHIGFIYNTAAANAVPFATIGTQITDWNSYTKGDVVIGTRNVITNSEPTERFRINSDGNVGIASASPAATLDVRQGSSNTNNKLVKFVDDVLSVYKVTGLSNHTVTLTCGSYFQAEVVITANQTNGGTNNNLYIRGIWSNNHHSHHWDEIENIGSLTGSSFSIAVSANDVSNSGKLVITHTYSSGSFNKMIVRVTDFSGAHSYSIT